MISGRKHEEMYIFLCTHIADFDCTNFDFTIAYCDEKISNIKKMDCKIVQMRVSNQEIKKLTVDGNL